MAAEETYASRCCQRRRRYDDKDHNDDDGNCYNDDCRKGVGSGGVKTDPVEAAVAMAGETAGEAAVTTSASYPRPHPRSSTSTGPPPTRSRPSSAIDAR